MYSMVQTFLNPIFPVFAIMLGGIVLSKRRLFSLDGARAINGFVFYIALPALIFSLISKAEIATGDWRLLGLYFLSEMGLYAAGSLIAWGVFRRTPQESLLLGMASCFVNHVFFVLPIAQYIYGDSAGIPITAIIVVDTTLIFGGTIVGLELSTHRQEPLWRVIMGLGRNPVLAAIFLGLMVNLLGLKIHEGIATFAAFAGRAASPAALFSLGILLAQAGGMKPDGAALATTGLKVFLHPLIAWLLFDLISPETLWHHAALLVAAGPCGAMPFVLALQYNVRADTIGKAIICSTLASLVTLSILAGNAA